MPDGNLCVDGGGAAAKRAGGSSLPVRFPAFWANPLQELKHGYTGKKKRSVEAPPAAIARKIEGRTPKFFADYTEHSRSVPRHVQQGFTGVFYPLHGTQLPEVTERFHLVRTAAVEADRISLHRHRLRQIPRFVHIVADTSFDKLRALGEASFNIPLPVSRMCNPFLEISEEAGARR